MTAFLLALSTLLPIALSTLYYTAVACIEIGVKITIILSSKNENRRGGICNLHG